MYSKNSFTVVAFHEITIHKDKRISVSHLELLKLNVFAHSLGACFRTVTSSSVNPLRRPHVCEKTILENGVSN